MITRKDIPDKCPVCNHPIKNISDYWTSCTECHFAACMESSHNWIQFSFDTDHIYFIVFDFVKKSIRILRESIRILRELESAYIYTFEDWFDWKDIDAWKPRYLNKIKMLENFK